MQQKIYLGESETEAGVGFYLEIEIEESGREARTVDLDLVPSALTLSISGYEVKLNSPLEGSCGGQIRDTILEHYPSSDKVKRLVEIWGQWQLNDLRAGTRKQNEALENFGGDYNARCEYLKSIELYEDNGHKYGHAWLVDPLPLDVRSEVVELVEELSRPEPDPLWKQIGLEMKWEFDKLRSVDQFVYQITLVRGKKVMGPFQYSKGLAHAVVVAKDQHIMYGLVTTKDAMQKYRNAKGVDNWQKYLMKYRNVTVEALSSIAMKHGLRIVPTPPSIEDVLQCICDDSRCAEIYDDGIDFAEDFGYTDMRKARDTWQAIKRQAKELKELLGLDLYRQFVEVE